MKQISKYKIQKLKEIRQIKNNEKEVIELLKDYEKINNYYKDNLKDYNENYLITHNDIKIFHFILKYLFNSLKYMDIKIFFGLHNEHIISKKYNDFGTINSKIEKSKYLIPKFINFLLFKYVEIARYLNISALYFRDNIFKLIKIFFLNDFINKIDMQMILFVQIIMCLYNEKEISKEIQNIDQIYLIINFLLSFCSNNSYSMDDNKMEHFNQIINYFIDIIRKHILGKINFKNKVLLSRNGSFYKLIYLCGIASISVTNKIIKLLVEIYIFDLKIDYIFDDLSDQFLFRTKKETITNKTNLLIAKNIFLNELLEKEKTMLKGEDFFLKNGFYFTESSTNGIVCDSINKFPNENDGYSIVTSFRLMPNDNEQINDKSVYTLFSIMNKENNLVHIYIENNKLKLRIKKEKKIHELYDIKNNFNYVLWIIQSKARKHKMILFLNGSKYIINSIYYPEGYFKINLGFSNCNNNYISKDNFEGIIGTFILFKKCLIKDENDNINIIKITELKGNYEDIIYIKSKREWGFINKDINLILNKMSNDIDIYQDIELIISTKSLGNLDFLYDANNLLGESLSEIYCNYFINSETKNNIKFYFRDKNNLGKNLNFPVQLQNSFIDLLNNHIFLYLQLELYYFISLISDKISETKDKNTKIKIFSNALEEEDFYLNISKICSLFFFCIDSVNSLSCLNKSQEELIENETNNFKYTLIDLISIYSKYDCKIKTYFLSLFVEKITEKKYFDYCIFVLSFDFYDLNNNEVLNILFNYLNHISKYDCDNNQMNQIFNKIMDFDKIYLTDKVDKSIKKEYSKLIRSLIKISIEEQISECFSLFRKKLKHLKKNFEKKNMFNDVSNIQEEEYNNENEKKSFRISFDETPNNNNENNSRIKVNSRKASLHRKDCETTNNESINNENLDILILIYKYLKNLYIAINDIKKKFVESCTDRINSIADFFNNLFNSLCEVYPIEDEEQYLKYVSSEKDKKEIIIAELIKCLCIRFLDDLFFEENLKMIKDDESKKQKNDENDSRKGSSGNLKKSFKSCKTNINLNKNSFKKDGSSNSIINMLNPLNNSKKSSFISNMTAAYKTVEEILTNKMEFFENLILSKYSFKSFFLMLFREFPNEKKIKYIKNEECLKKPLLLTEKNITKTIYVLRVIISLFEKQNNGGFDTLFMSKIELIEYSYNLFIGLFKDMLNNYLKIEEDKKKKIKPMINSIFAEKGNYYIAHKFYKIMIDIVCNFNFNGCSENNQNYHEIIKDNLDKFMIKIQNDINEFINNTLFELIDPFYFKLLSELFFENNTINEYVINLVIMIIEKIIPKMNKESKNRIIEINCKNLLILLYKMLFFVNKRNIILYSENELFIKKIILFLSQFIEHCNILYTKILFPIEDSRGKLLMEILFEIIFELHLEFLRNPKILSLQIIAFIFKSIFNEKKIKTNLSGHFRHKKDEVYTPFYIMDEMSYFNANSNNTNQKININDEDIIVNKQFYDLKDYIFKKYKDEIKENKDFFSVCILFCIKIILSINELEEFYKNNNNSSQTVLSNAETNCDSKYNDNENFGSKNIYESSEDLFMEELKTQFVNSCKNIIKIHKEHTSSNPFKSIGYYAKNLYEHFRSFIVDKFSFTEGDPNNKIEELKKNINKYKSDLKFFSRVIYTKDGRTKLYTDKMYNQILKTIQNEILIKDTDSVGSFDKISRHSSDGRNSIQLSHSKKSSFINNSERAIGFSSVKNLKKLGFYKNHEVSKSQNLLTKKNLNKSIYNNNNKYIYIKTLKFKKDLIRTYFSSYFKKLLTYDEDFINIKNLYILTYNKEIKNIDEYKFLYPTKLKSYITNNYTKMFLKRDFNFFTDGYFKYSHDYIYNKKFNYNYSFQNKLLFPQKKLIKEFDSAHKDISSSLKDLITYDCELLTVKGSIFGNIFVFENGLLFKSELINDKRCKDYNLKEDENLLDYACSTIEYDFLKVDKTLLFEFNDIKEVVNRTFFYTWISLEIFLKDGKSFLFNLFNEYANDDLLDFLKQKKIPVIRRVGEYFKKEEFSKKWAEDKITTFDYLLLLNKFSSRSYNDPNQYPIMPWLFLEQGPESKRNFDLPISVQDKDKQDYYLSKTENFVMEDNSVSHGNHYSTSAYICFYLMRANPFTNNMIKFQSNSFDIPDRQYSDMKQTIFLCQRMFNNREMIPELYSIPEIYINLNGNDFGKQKDGVRVHNITFQPYSQNSIEFSYMIKDLINNNIEINNQINRWFDFIFGVNQLGNYSSNKNLNSKEKEKLKSLRKFNPYCYGQFYNFKKVYNEALKKNKNSNDIYEDIKMSINISINFGQCPYQLLNEVHPIKKKYFNISDNCSTNSTPSNENFKIGDNFPDSRYNSIISNKSNKENTIMPNQKVEDIYKIKGGGDIIYFEKSSNNSYLYCLLSNRTFEIYKYDFKNNKFIMINFIIPKCQFLFFKHYKNKLIYKPKYVFCELNENAFIFCRTLDKTLIYYNLAEKIEATFVLKSYTTCLLQIENNDFITGHDNGRLCKWRINYSIKNKKVELELVELIKSNKNSITCLIFNEKLNIIASSDINNIVIRKNHDLEYLNSIEIQNKEKFKKSIVDIKISDYNFIYILIYLEEKDLYELQGFTLNGIYFGNYIGNCSNFQISRSGKIIINEMDKSLIKILDPIKLNEIYNKDLKIKGENLYFQFYFERPNLLYYGVKNNDSTKIKILFLDTDDEKFFS